MIVKALLAIVLALPIALQAATPDAKLKATQTELKQSQARADELAKSKSSQEKELAELQEKLVKLASAARSREQRLLDLEEEQSQLDGEMQTAQEDLKIHHKEISVMVASLIRLSRIPPEAVVAMPGKLRHTMQAASLLESITQQLHQKAGELHSKLNRLELTQRDLTRNRKALAAEKENTKEAQAELAQKVAERKTLVEAFNRQHAKLQDKIVMLTRESRSLQQLLDKLERDRKTKAAEAQKLVAKPLAKPLSSAPVIVPAKPPQTWEPAKPPVALPTPAATKPDRQFASFNAARGKLSLPVAGSISARYGQSLGKNQTSRGLNIASRAGNAVLAPYSGEVVFTGPFLDYGRMVILRYDSGYHLLMAGLDEINCVVGQRVVRGEPIGRLSASGKQSGKLYLELRHQSKPINPAPWFG